MLKLKDAKYVELGYEFGENQTISIYLLPLKKKVGCFNWYSKLNVSINLSSLKPLYNLPKVVFLFKFKSIINEYSSYIDAAMNLKRSIAKAFFGYIFIYLTHRLFTTCNKYLYSFKDIS